MLGRSARGAVLVVLSLSAALPPVAGAVGPDQRRDGRAFFDARSTPANANRVAAPPAARSDAADRLRSALGPQGLVAFDRVTGTPRSVAKLDGFLTEPTSAAPADVALGYVAAHADLFGLDHGDIAGLRLTRSYTDTLGTTHLTWAQTLDGVPTIDNGIRAAVTRTGRLVSVQGSPVPDLSAAATGPKLSAAEALRAARGDAGIKGPLPAAKGRLAIYTSFGGPRLAWRVLADKSSTQLYDYTIDASTGRVLHRENTVKFATGLAWDYFPGPFPLANSGTATSRDFTASGWLASNATTLNGNNTHTYFDLLDDNTPAAGDEVAPSSGSNWNYPFTAFNGFSCIDTTNFPCSWDSWTANSWQTNANQTATQLFYFVNKFHDYLAASPFGFTEAAGNFQVTNSSGQGFGGDAVQAQVLDGANTASGFPDGAHQSDDSMGTRADGTPPRLQTHLMTGRGNNGGDVNGSDDAFVVYHEYTHGLSSRLVTDNNGNPALGAQQAGSMGEGWSDWYAMDYLVNHGYDADTASVGDVNPGYYIAGGPGLRTQPLDCVPAVTDDPCTNFNGAGDGGYTYADFGKVLGSPEVHADGEIWGQTLWQLRRQLIAKYGVSAGDQRAETYITRGMELTPPNPSMIDARNGILQAETVATAAGGPYAGSDDDDVLWSVFANRGMGYYAAALDGNDVAPVADFNQPPASGAPRGSLHGTVIQTDGGAPAGGARVEIGGHNSGLGGDLAATVSASGSYTIGNVPNGTYPYVFAGGPGYDRTVVSNVTVSGSTTRNFSARRNWAQADGGGLVSLFSAPDISGSGCGPGGAIDGALATGWGSTSPTSSQGPGGAKQITIRLPRPITLTQFGVDPGATCGDDDNASLGGYKIETSPDGTTFTAANSGTFTASQNHRIVHLTPAGGTANVRYVRLTMKTPQSTSGSGADWMDMSELKVYGTPVAPAPVGSGWSAPASVKGDFNADGFADLAVGAPGENAGAGAVHVIYGGATGLTSTGSQQWSQNSTGVPDGAEEDDAFGAALAVGDLNHDGRADLAVGVPGENDGAGAVEVLYGSATGLTGAHSQLWSQNSAGIADSGETDDHFGAALAIGNFEGSAAADLAIGVPDEDTVATDSGIVHVLPGSGTGATSTGSQWWSQNSSGIADSPENGDHFGASLAAGNLDAGAYSELAIGVPGEALPAAGSGAVNVLVGSTSGLTATGSQLWSQASPGIADGPEAGDHFGATLAIGNLGNSSHGDLAIGVPGENTGAGAVNVIYGSASGLTSTGNQLWSQNSSGIANNAAAGDQFGAALAVGNVGGTTVADLAVGAPGDNSGAGVVNVIYGASSGLASASNQLWSQASPNIAESSESGDRFGAALTIADMGNGTVGDLAIGVPGESFGTALRAGGVNVIYGSASGLASGSNQFWSQRSAGIADTAETDDGFGGGLGG